MRIQVQRSVFADAVAWTARSVPTRPGTIPQLAGILLRTGPDGLTLSGFDYETSATGTIPATVADEGEALVSGRLLADIARSLPDRPVDLALDGPKLSLRCGTSRFTLQTMPVQDYPALPQMPDVVGSVDASSFATAVTQAVTAAGRDDMLPVLTGVKIEIQGTTLGFLATDRFRLSLREIPWRPLQTDIDTTALVPARVLAETVRSMTAAESLDIALSASGNGNSLIGFATKGESVARTTTTRLIEGAFPNVRQLFPNTSNVTAELSVAELVEAVKRVSLVAGRNTPVRLAFDDAQVTLQAGNGEEAEASESLAAVIEGGELTIGFNPSYLLDGLGAITGSHVHIAMTEPARPAAFTSMSGPDEKPDLDFSYLLMPLRMQG